VPPYTTRPRSASADLSDSPLKKGQEEDSKEEEGEEKVSSLRLETIAAGEEKVFAHPEQVERKNGVTPTSTPTPGKSTDGAESSEEKGAPESCSDSDTEKAKRPVSEPSTSTSTSMAATLESRLEACSSRDSTPPPKSKQPSKSQAAKRRASQEIAVKQPKQRR